MKTLVVNPTTTIPAVSSPSDRRTLGALHRCTESTVIRARLTTRGWASGHRER